MTRPPGSRMLIAICGVLVVLLAALATVQYRWSTRVAAADVQREKEHLDSAASLFAREFNGTIAQAVQFLQNEAWDARQSGERIERLPKLIAELYYTDIPERGARTSGRLTAGGVFAPAPLPGWAAVPRCAVLALDQPPAIVVPIFDAATTEIHGPAGTRFLKQLSRQPERCFIARMDETYQRDVLFPQLIRRSFGETAAGDYDFAVVLPGRARRVIYGGASRADLARRFFSVDPAAATMKPPSSPPPGPGRNRIYVRRLETVITGGQRGMAELFGPGIWQLEVAHKGLPLAAAFERTRRRDLLLSLGVELLLVAAIAFLVIGARRMQRLADQKMQFIAGVSHELRAPVSAISMLSRNQADGLLTAPEKVKQYGQLIHQQSRRLSEMVEQTLQYAGIHSGLRHPAKDEIDLGSLIRDAVDAQREEFARRGFEVELALDPAIPAVRGDAKLLRMAFDNLLSNSLKYAAAGRWIRVSTGYSAPQKECTVSVEDRGEGIEPGDQAAIFEPFYRGRAAIEAQIPGSGIGLSLVRSAVEAHHGSVTVVSKPGRGSTFTLHLPV